MRIGRVLCVALACLAPGFGGGWAQTRGLPVTAGEHPGFTRIVIHAPPGSAWQLDGGTSSARVTVSGPVSGFDLSRLFDRIGRSRLAAAQAVDGALALDLACPCPVRAWEERPGVIVIDVSDPPPAPEDPEPPPEAPAPVALAPPIDAARAAGQALARSRAQALSPAPAPPPELPAASELVRDLGLPIAQALAQGVLTPAIADPTRPADPLLPDPVGPVPALPANMRIATALERPALADDPGREQAPLCPEGDRLGFLLDGDHPPFDREFADLTRRLYGEFDQPDPAALEGLIGLFLRSGFGAEARALIVNAPEPVAGRDLLLGLSDVFEERASNSRLRLAEASACPGATGLFALLAGQAPAPATGTELALTFTRLPPSLRAQIGAETVDRLVQAGNLDAARVVRESLARSAWASPALLGLVDARLERARGLPEAAAAQLDRTGAADALTARERIDLALQSGPPLPSETLPVIEALAAAERNDENGIALMAGVIRLRARGDAFAEAFAGLDRLDRWLAPTPSNDRLIADLREEVWRAVTDRATDLVLAETILTRSDWGAEGLSPETRRLLAGRLVDLGLGGAVPALIAAADSAEDRSLLARGALDAGDGAAVLRLLDGLQTEDADLLRVRARSIDAAPQPDATPLPEDPIGSPGPGPSAPSAAPQGTAPGDPMNAVPDLPDAAAGASVSPVREPEAPRADGPARPLAAEATPDLADRPGLIARSSALLEESSRLRAALGPLIAGEGR